jgi:uncharacterized membrane protein
MAELIHRHWLDWAFWSMVGVYVTVIPVLFYGPLVVVPLTLAVVSVLFVYIGFWADHVTYRRMKRGQER